MDASQFVRKVQESIISDLTTLGVTNLPHQWDFNDHRQYLCVQFNKSHNRSTGLFRIVISVLQSPLDNRNIGFVICGFLISKYGAWDEIASMSLLECNSLQSENTLKAFQNFYEELFLEEPTPIEKGFQVSLVGERIMKKLSPRDICNLMISSKRMCQLVGQSTYDMVIWKNLLRSKFGESAVREAERKNVSYFSEYRNQSQEAHRRRQYDDYIPVQDIPERFNYWPSRHGSFMDPYGTVIPFVPAHIGEEHRSRVPPSMRPTIFNDAMASRLRLPGPNGVGGEIPDEQRPVGSGTGNPDPNFRLMGDGYRRQPDFDEHVAPPGDVFEMGARPGRLGGNGPSGGRFGGSGSSGGRFGGGFGHGYGGGFV